MQDTITDALTESINTLTQKALLPDDLKYKLFIERTKNPSHGDFACNIAMQLAKQAGQNPRDLAKAIVDNLPKTPVIDKVDIAGPGFINIYVTKNSLLNIIPEILNTKENYGRQKPQDTKLHLEFVSANPTGPLHVGHGRAAAYGSALAHLLKFAGYSIDSEYYVNDAGRQMDILATSVWLRYLELNGIEFDFPQNGYRGDYVKVIAKQVHNQYANQFVMSKDQIQSNLPLDGHLEGGDKEQYIDALIQKAKALLNDQYAVFFDSALLSVKNDIQQDLKDMGVCFDLWFSEQSLFDEGWVDKAIAQLKSSGFTLEKEGALWFKSSELGDDKDRVLIRENGQSTYFASDAAYLLQKMSRGYDKLIMILGADHHGYIPRLRALFTAFGFNPDQLVVPLVQFAVLYRHGEQVQMSTRSGSFVTLRELREEVGTQATRLFYIMRKMEQHLDFDLDIAKSKSNENPLYYIQYAHARICSVFRQLQTKGWSYTPLPNAEHLNLLSKSTMEPMVIHLAKFPEIIEQGARKLEVHTLVFYLKELAQLFHAFYNVEPLLIDNESDRNIKLCLIDAVAQVIKNGLSILGIQAMEEM